MTSTPTINTYVSDMLALEQHMLSPLQHQADDEDVRKYSAASAAITQALAATNARIQTLETHLTALGGHAGSPLKSGVASALGSAAAAISNVRKTEVSKYVRDDYSAFALASAAYTMLYTTALALHADGTAQIAQDGLKSVAASVLQFSHCLPGTVLGELREEGVAVDQSVVEKAEKDTSQAWTTSESRVN